MFRRLDNSNHIVRCNFNINILQLGKDNQKGETKKILLISGNIHEVTVRQIQKARERGFPVFNLSDEAKFINEYLDTETGREFIENLIEKFREHRLVAIEAISGREAMEKSRKYAADHGISDEDARMRVTGMLGKMACKIIEKVKIDILAVFGGDTLMEIIKSMRAAGVRPLHEIEPGTVISDLIGGKYPIQIVSKSGGLGTEDIVRNIVYYFNE